MSFSTASQGVRRVQLELSDERLIALECLMSQCEIRTRVDLINTALSVLEWMLEERQSGRIIASVDEANMRYKELMIPAFSAARAAQRHGLANSVG